MLDERRTDTLGIHKMKTIISNSSVLGSRRKFRAYLLFIIISNSQAHFLMSDSIMTPHFGVSQCFTVCMSMRQKLDILLARAPRFTVNIISHNIIHLIPVY